MTTVNRQKTFYYKITGPMEVWGNYHTQIAFFDMGNKLVYHRQGCFAHAFQVGNLLEFVKWSDTGEFVLFYEFKRGSIPGGGIYDYLFIDLIEKRVYRVDQHRHKNEFLDILGDNEFNGEKVINQINNLDIEMEYCFTDKIIVDPFKRLIGIERWRPSGKL